MTDTRQWLIEEFREQLRQSLASMTGESSVVEPGAAPDPAEGALLWWEQPLSVSPDAVVWVAASESAWREIGKCTLQAAGIEECEPAEMQSTWREILSQALSALARSIGARLKKEVTCPPGRESAPQQAEAAGLAVMLGASPVLPLALVFSPGLLALLSPQGVPAVPEQAAVPALPRTEDPVSKAVETSKTLDLLLEVELPVSVSFGRAQLRLKDVIKLTTGSIVELNRSVSEPVEVIVNNCVIARGEVVVLDGYYGVRIHQIISRQERLRTLV